MAPRAGGPLGPRSPRGGPDRPPLPARLVVLLGSLLAPAHRREELRRQWRGDLVHRWRRTSDRSAAALRLTLWATGVVPHALQARRRHRSADGIRVDVVQALRSLRRRPGTALLAVIVLALGIGASLAVASLAISAFLRPLPFPEGERLVRVWSANPRAGFDRSSLSLPDYRDFRDSPVLAGASVWVTPVADLAGEGVPERIVTAMVDEGFFETLGADALAGRLLGPSDHAADAARAVVLSRDLWERRFGGDPGVVGTDVRLNGSPHTVAGILDRDHAWPLQAEAWVSFRWGGSPPEIQDRRDNHGYQMVARLAPGVDPEAATRRLSEVSLAARSGDPDTPEKYWQAEVVPLHQSLYPASARRGLLLVGGAVLAVLLVACMNAAGLLLVQARRRSREIALRSALGAGRRRLLRQVLVESLVLAAVAAAAGSLLAAGGLRWALASAPASLARLGELSLDGWMIGAALALTVASALVAGLGPALSASRPDVVDTLKKGNGQASAGRGGRRGQRTLVVLEIALTTVLLAAAGLSIRSFQGMVRADPGFRADGVLAFDVVVPRRGVYEDDAALLDFYRSARERLAAIPGVEAASVTSTTPLGGPGLNMFRVFLPEGAPEPPAGTDHTARWVEVDEAYFRTLDLRPVEGRAFTADDGPDGEPVMIVTEELARRLAPEGSALGMRVRSWRDENVYRRVVGVVPRPAMEGQVGGEVFPVVFVPQAQSARGRMSFLLRVRGEPLSLAPAVRAAVEEVDPDLAVAGLATLRDFQRDALGPFRFLAGAFTAFGIIALLMAVAGIYGLVAFSVASRSREIGIRMAVGASATTIRRMVLREGMLLLLLGLGMGLAAGLALTRAVASVVTGVTWLDVPSWAGTLALLGTAALLATLVPALRATRVDPSTTLREE